MRLEFQVKMGKGNKRNQNIQPKLVCIFCGKTPLTREHFWSSWMKEVFPQSKYNYHARFESSSNDVTLQRPSDGNHKKVTGPPGSWQLKVVCSECNNNWMNRIETEAKPFITELAFSNPISLFRYEQEVLSKWVFLKLIIGEYDSNETRIITADQRQYFYKYQLIPSPWKIWIAKNSSAIWGNLFNQTLGTLTYTDISSLKLGTYRYKAAIFIIGELTIHIGKFSLQEANLISGHQFDYMIIGQHANKVMKIYPSNNSIIKWNKVEKLTDSELHLLYNNLVTFYDAIRRFH